MRNSIESPTIERRQVPYIGFSNLSSHRISNKPGGSNIRSCTYCRESGHSRLRCYEIIGYPDWWDFNKKPRKNIEKAALATVVNEHPPPSASANVAHSRMFDKASIFEGYLDN